MIFFTAATHAHLKELVNTQLNIVGRNNIISQI